MRHAEARTERSTRSMRWAGLMVLLVLALLPAVQAGAAGAPPSPPPREPGVAPPLETPFSVAPGVERRTVSYGPAGLAHTLDVYTAAGSRAPRPTVLLIHGGGWSIGDSTEWSREAVTLVREQGWTAVSVNYRLLATAAWPAPFEDASAALRLLQRRGPELGIDPARIGAIGDSAGGQLAGLLGEPGLSRPALAAVVTWSGINDLTGLTTQSSAGGCAPDATGCTYRGLAGRAVDELMACAPAACAAAYRSASPAADVTSEHAPTMSVNGEDELIDPRQAWVMDAALDRAGVQSRIEVVPGRRHGRGLQSVAWDRSLAFLGSVLEPGASRPVPPPTVDLTLDLPSSSEAAVGRGVTVSGTVGQPAAATTVTLQVQQDGEVWRTARIVPVVRDGDALRYRASWTPAAAGPVVWRALWRGSGAETTTTARTVTVR